MLARVVALWITLPLLTSFFQAQSPTPGFLEPPPGETAMRPKIGCSDVRSLTGYDFSIESATVVPAVGDVPEHCLVRGLIQPEIRFEVTLPATWNRRFYMTGNGGYAGESLDAPARSNARNQAARRGFVLAASNTGHDGGIEPLGTFAVNQQKLLDYAFRSLKVTADAGKQIAASYYASRPGVPGFFRLFMVPGMFHCGGGVGCGTFDKLTPTIEWVEKGAAPDRIEASQMVAGKPVRTRPLCPYPQVAVYGGQGSSDEAVNFACKGR